ncbi:MAG: hypothetical protein ABIQ41_02025, partial [Gemmatimonadales bacterium]
RRPPPKKQEYDDRRDSRRPTRQEGSRDFESRARTSTRDSTRDQGRDQSKDFTRDIPRRTQMPNNETATYDDDADLIGEVRRQQQPARL